MTLIFKHSVSNDDKYSFVCKGKYYIKYQIDDGNLIILDSSDQYNNDKTFKLIVDRFYKKFLKIYISISS